MNNLTSLQEGLLNHNIVDLEGEIRGELAAYLRTTLQQLRIKGSPSIEIHITSPGGSVDIGLDMYDMIRYYSGTKTATVIGYASSMAPVIMQACEERRALKHSHILIHHLSENRISLDTIRNKRRLGRVRKSMEDAQQSIYAILSSRTGKSVSVIKEICAKDQPLTAQEALDFGLIDKII